MAWSCLDKATRGRLQDIVEHADELAADLQGATASSFAQDRRLQRVAERLLEICGEAAKHLPEAITDAIAADWSKLRGMRIILAHAYHRVDVPTLWAAATKDLPRLAAAVRAHLEE